MQSSGIKRIHLGVKPSPPTTPERFSSQENKSVPI